MVSFTPRIKPWSQSKFSILGLVAESSLILGCESVTVHNLHTNFMNSFNTLANILLKIDASLLRFATFRGISPFSKFPLRDLNSDKFLMLSFRSFSLSF